MGDTLLLKAAREEVAEIKEVNDLKPDQPVKYEPQAWTRRGTAD